MDIEITKEEFEKYKDVKDSGSVNMDYINAVSDLTELPRSKILFIMRNFEALKCKFNEGKQ